MGLDAAQTALVAGMHVGLPVTCLADLKTAHRIADILAVRLGVQLGRMPFIDRPLLVIWIPGKAPDPLERRPYDA